MSRSRRVLYVAHVARLGGGERSLLDLLAVLDRSRFEPAVLLPGRGELSEALDAAGVRWIANRHLRRFRRSRRLASAAQLIHGAVAVLRDVRRVAPHLLHANSTTAALYSVLASRLVGVPLVWHVRDLVPLGRLGRWLGAGAACTVAPSMAVRGLVASLGGGGRLEVIASGIDVARFAGDGPGARDSDPADWSGGGGARVVAIGQLVPWKNHELLVAAAAEVHRRAPDVRFLIIGDDRFRDHPREADRLRARVVELGLAEVVRLAGFRADVAGILGASDLLAHAAYPEPFGRVVVEAMAAATPVVAFAGEHGPAETVRDGVDGLLVAPRTAAALAQGLLRLLGDREGQRRMADSACRRARELFDRRLTTRRIEGLYGELLAARESPPVASR